MDPIFVRTARIIGEKGIDFLSTKTVAVFGIGGVGSYAAEALVRAGVGHLIFIDKDAVEDSNLNRQLVADRTTLGRNKAEIMVERAHRVNPACYARALALAKEKRNNGCFVSLVAKDPDISVSEYETMAAKHQCAFSYVEE